MLYRQTNNFEPRAVQIRLGGFTLSVDGYHFDHSITDAITKFPTPSNGTDL